MGFVVYSIRTWVQGDEKGMWKTSRRKGHVPVVMLTTSETTTTRVFAVLAYTTVSGGDVSAVLASLRKSGRHFLCKTQ